MSVIIPKLRSIENDYNLAMAVAVHTRNQIICPAWRKLNVKTLTILIAALSLSLAHAKDQSPSGTEVKRLDNELKKLIGDGLTGETEAGKKCEVTFAPQDILYRNKPTGEKYDELVIMSKDSAYQDCGVNGINFIIDKEDLAGQGKNISKVSIGQTEIFAGASAAMPDGDGGTQTWGRILKIELENGSARSVQLSVVGKCICNIKK
jgi:hypothetical protein